MKTMTDWTNRIDRLSPLPRLAVWVGILTAVYLLFLLPADPKYSIRGALIWVVVGTIAGTTGSMFRMRHRD